MAKALSRNDTHFEFDSSNDILSFSEEKDGMD